VIEFLFALVVWLTPAGDVAALQRTANLSPRAAAENLAAARIAASVYKLDADLLLAIAWRESRYQSDTIGPVVRGKRACGVMQPIMERTCEPPGLLDGYLAGAAHLRAWRKATRTELDALVGYAGGYAMIERCKLGPIERERAGRMVDLCSAPELRRADWIRLERKRSTRVLVVW
jgi:hypothetical protein